MAKYANDTEVSVEKSRAEIETLLKRYGATKFGFMSDDSMAVLAFEAQRRRIRFQLRLPPKENFQRTAKQQLKRSSEAQQSAWDKECRRLWRALALVIKAKLEAVQSGISVFEDEFLANIVMPDGRTVGEATRPAIEAAYQGNPDVPLLPDYRSKP